MSLSYVGSFKTTVLGSVVYGFENHHTLKFFLFCVHFFMALKKIASVTRRGKVVIVLRGKSLMFIGYHDVSSGLLGFPVL